MAKTKDDLSFEEKCSIVKKVVKNNKAKTINDLIGLVKQQSLSTAKQEGEDTHPQKGLSLSYSTMQRIVKSLNLEHINGSYHFVDSDDPSKRYVQTCLKYPKSRILSTNVLLEYSIVIKVHQGYEDIFKDIIYKEFKKHIHLCISGLGGVLILCKSDNYKKLKREIRQLIGQKKDIPDSIIEDDTTSVEDIIPNENTETLD